jgi:large subunit ribosomal protein L3
MRATDVAASKRRTGLIAKKLGMTSIYDQEGNRFAVTLLEVKDCYVSANKTLEKDGYCGVQVAAFEAKPNRVSKAMKGHFAKAGITPKVKTKEFVVSKDALVENGTKLSVNHYVIGQYIDIQGYTIGRGFSGVMKRHNFRGLEATHGVSITHRSHGSTGMCQDPGKVLKGKKMAGRYGNEKVTIQNLKVVDIDQENGILVVKGAVPGHKGSYVTISDAVKRFVHKDAPFPTLVENKE